MERIKVYDKVTGREMLDIGMKIAEMVLEVFTHTCDPGTAAQRLRQGEKIATDINFYKLVSEEVSAK